MRKLILLIILWIVVMYYFPDSRSMVERWAHRLWLPLVEWDARQEMQQIGRDVVEEGVRTGKIPDQRNWVHWLEYRYASSRMRHDPWGSLYHLKVWRDSVGIFSDGPDRTWRTTDDFHVTVPRVRKGS